MSASGVNFTQGRVVATFEPVKYRVQQMVDSQWSLVGDYDSALDATARASDITKTYNLRTQVLEIPR